MHGLIGERLLKRFLGGILHPTETDAMNEAESPQNDGKTTDRSGGPKPKGSGKRNIEPVEERTLADGKTGKPGLVPKGRREE
jgi:hypothetical protein